MTKTMVKKIKMMKMMDSSFEYICKLPPTPSAQLLAALLDAHGLMINCSHCHALHCSWWWLQWWWWWWWWSVAVAVARGCIAWCSRPHNNSSYRIALHLMMIMITRSWSAVVTRLEGCKGKLLSYGNHSPVYNAANYISSAKLYLTRPTRCMKRT